MIRSANRAQATAVYESITATLPCDFIRRRFQALALTAEAFITIRSEFAQTLAVSSLFGYILGKSPFSCVTLYIQYVWRGILIFLGKKCILHHLITVITF